MRGLPFEENGYTFISINEDSFGAFLSYKIEKHVPDKTDVSFSFNALFPKNANFFIQNLVPRIQNRIRELAAFQNPAMGMSNFANSRYIYLGRDAGEYIRIPRGLLEDVTAQFDKAGIANYIRDERCRGNAIRISFQGQLKESQILAVEPMMKYETGILRVATAFGKTVVCCNMIAEKRSIH